VRDAIANDPRIPYPAEIAVEAYGGACDPARHGRQLRRKRAATAVARRTRGVDTVHDELRVRLMDRDQREDADIRGAALQRLIWDPQLVADYLSVEVKDGWVTLKATSTTNTRATRRSTTWRACTASRHHQPDRRRRAL
jgi:osmotically-inducible protein OsmY